MGSFKTIDGTGKLSMDFQGTVLVDAPEGPTPPKFTGNVTLEYTGHKRVVYFGTGHMSIDGKWRAIQWFGKDLKAVWTGNGMIRLIGDFDKNLNTGTYYYDDPKDIKYWQTAIVPVFLPEQHFGTGGQPRERTTNGAPGPQ